MFLLEISGKGNVVVLKREPSECYINNYNGPVMLAWQANMDLQYVHNAYACVMYVSLLHHGTGASRTATGVQQVGAS